MGFRCITQLSLNKLRLNIVLLLLYFCVRGENSCFSNDDISFVLLAKSKQQRLSFPRWSKTPLLSGSRRTRSEQCTR